MAILVRYEGDESTSVAYLSQSFYEHIHRMVRSDATYPILGKISRLKYKSLTLTVSRDQVASLEAELERMEQTSLDHPECQTLIHACRQAVDCKIGLWVSGDMHPELKD